MKKRYLAIFLVFIFQSILPVLAVEPVILKVGIYQNEPKIFLDNLGKPAGLWVDILEHISAKEGWRLTYVAGTWQQCLDRLEKGEIDILPDVAFTEKRSRIYQFNKETVLSNWAYVYGSDSQDIENIEDLKHKKVAVMKGDISFERFKLFNIPCSFVICDDFQGVFRAIDAEKADAGIISRLYGQFYEDQYRVKRTLIIIAPVELRFAFPMNSDTEYAIAIDRHLAELKNSPNSFYNQTLDKWFSERIKWAIPWKVKFALSVSVILVALFVILSLLLNKKVLAKTLELEKSEELYRAHFQNASDVIYSIGPDFKLLTISPSIERVLGYKPEELAGRLFTEINILAPESLPQVIDDMMRILKGESISTATYEFISKSGEKRFCEISSAPLWSDNKVVANIAVARDITDRKRAEVELSRSNRALQALSQCNEALIRATTEADLLNDICRVIGEVGGYPIVWIGYAEEDKETSLRPVEQIGFEDGFLESLNITWADTEKGRGPMGIAIHTGRPFTAKNIPTDPDLEIWREEATKYGYASFIAIPLIANDETFGVMNIYAKEPDAFSAEEAELLTQLVNDLAYGINALRTRTERKRAEEALRESNDYLDNLINYANAPIIVWDPEFRITRFNHAFEKLTGRTVGDVIGKNLEILFPPALVQSSMQLIKKTLSGERWQTVEICILHVDGVVSTLLWNSATIFDKDGITPVATIAQGHDITERKQAEEELKQSKVRFELATAATNIGHWDWDLRTNEVYFSPLWKSQLGYKEHEVPNRFEEWDSRLHPDDRNHTVKAVTDYIEGRSPEYALEFRLRHKDGTYRWIYTRADKQFDDDDGRPCRLFGCHIDITERKRMEVENLRSQRLESVGMLAGGIAHDFNNILSSIIGFTELALDEVEKDTKIEDSLQEVYAAGKRAKDLVKQILAFARQSDEEIKPIQPGEIAKEVLKFIRSSIPTSIEIKQNIESDSLIMGNTTQLHQVLMNLCTNAAHAMEDKGGTLELSLKDVVIDSGGATQEMGITPGDYIEIMVSDTGVGIQSDIIGSIFEPYFTTKGVGEGTGIGLAMVYGIVEKYGGKITVDSELGKGTVFTIYLPITRKRQEHRPYEPGELPYGTERILFVDDELPVAKMGAQVLERLGYSVTTRTSSVEALELLRSKPNDFDLVITDMTMPNMSGDKLAVELMKIRPDIPVILCTGYSKKISDETAAILGIKAFAYKPIIKSDLAKTVRKVLDESKS